MYMKIIKQGRFHFLLGGLLLFLFGAVLGNGSLNFNPLTIILAYLPVLFGHLSISYSNNYFDMDHDQKTEKRMFSGGSNLANEDSSFKSLIKNISLFLIILSLFLGVFNFFYFNLEIEYVLLILLANMFGWYYSSNPVRLVDQGLGEVSTAIGFAFLIPYFGFVLFSSNLAQLLSYFIPMFVLGLCFIISVEIPDYKADLKTNKTNLIVRLGLKNSKLLLLILSVLVTFLFSYNLILLAGSILLFLFNLYIFLNEDIENIMMVSTNFVILLVVLKVVVLLI